MCQVWSELLMYNLFLRFNINGIKLQIWFQLLLTDYDQMSVLSCFISVSNSVVKIQLTNLIISNTPRCHCRLLWSWSSGEGISLIWLYNIVVPDSDTQNCALPRSYKYKITGTVLHKEIWGYFNFAAWMLCWFAWFIEFESFWNGGCLT